MVRRRLLEPLKREPEKHEAYSVVSNYYRRNNVCWFPYPAADVASVWNQLALNLSIGDNLSKFHLDVIGIGRLTTEARQNHTSLGNAAALDEVTRRVGEEEQARSKNDTEEELDADGNTV